MARGNQGEDFVWVQEMQSYGNSCRCKAAQANDTILHVAAVK